MNTRITSSEGKHGKTPRPVTGNAAQSTRPNESNVFGEKKIKSTIHQGMFAKKCFFNHHVCYQKTCSVPRFVLNPYCASGCYCSNEIRPNINHAKKKLDEADVADGSEACCDSSFFQFVLHVD